ncbi:hypothetical protein [Paenibacillus glacialis]|uniref:Uncharacterized protein n=1 Tax=Paenibacillus glacialis TaxID=494026 RepID=A0A168KA10_9BACL|nr:hypothetical protein [Paenibacillus glacialis]OAB41755.1 hypothetical protein PGLA_15920 [Paenibacillus glacialis]
MMKEREERNMYWSVTSAKPGQAGGGNRGSVQMIAPGLAHSPTMKSGEISGLSETTTCRYSMLTNGSTMTSCRYKASLMKR